MMYSRGQFAVMGKVGRKTLRLYHEEGLLVPAHTNEANGYHYYAEEQLAVLARIKRLRAIGLSLFEIKEVLDGKASEDRLVKGRIREMRAEKDTLFFPRLGIISPQEARRHMELSKRYLKDGRILKDALAADKRYPYGALRTEAQAHMLFKAQELIDQRLIRGTFENGTEFLILSAVLALPKEMTRLIQAYDFTKTNPKLLVVHTEESEGSLEDAILLTYLSLLGFDVVLFVPTGYQTIERHLASRRMVEHEIGPYRFGVKMPDLDTLPPVKKGLQWLTDFLKRGI